MSSRNEIRDMLFMSHSLDIISDEELLLLLMANSSKSPRKSTFPYDDYEPFSLDDVEDSQCKSDFRFEKKDIPLLAEVLELPGTLRCSRRITVENVEGLCLLLKQMANPCQKRDLISCFGRPMSELRMITNKIINYLYSAQGHRITKWNQELLSPAHLQGYAEAISLKEAAINNCFGFVDCPVRQNNRKVFNGEQRVYSLKYQTVVLPNGLIAHIYGPIEGEKHDTILLHESNLLHNLEQFAFSPNGRAMCLYGNPLYPISIHLQAPFKNNSTQMTPEKKACDKSMRDVQTSTEWIFPDVINSFKFLDYQNSNNITLDYFAKMNAVCCLVRNALTCFYGNETAKFFDLEPPRIEEYFS